MKEKTKAMVYSTDLNKSNGLLTGVTKREDKSSGLLTELMKEKVRVMMTVMKEQMRRLL